MFYMYKIKLFFIFTFSFLILNCTKEVEDTSITLTTKSISCKSNTNIVSCSAIDVLDALSIRTYLQLLPSFYLALIPGIGGNVNNLQYDIRAIKVVYPVVYKGKTINSSAIIMFPTNKGTSLSLSVAQHGTQIDAKETPSTWSRAKLNLESTATNVLMNNISYLPSALYDSMIGGSYTIMPDYLGIGESSKDVFHPFHVAESYGIDGVAAIRAAREVASQNGITLNNKLFLRGYSEGGYATLALQKYIESNSTLSAEIQITASAPAAGAYNLLETAKILLQQTNFEAPSYLPYVYLGYEDFYGLDKTLLSTLFQTPYSDRIRNLYNGSLTRSEVDAQLTKNISEQLVTPAFKTSINTTNDTLPTKLKDNDLTTGWSPKAPTRFYVCKGDTTVPIQNTTIHAKNLIPNEKSSDVHNSLPNNESAIITIEGGTHASCSGFTLAVTQWFNKF